MDWILITIQWIIIGLQWYSIYHCKKNNKLAHGHWYGISFWAVIPVFVLGMIVLLN